MSPHILIDQALEGVADPSNQSDIDVLVQSLITRLFNDGAITAEEFTHYCKRLMEACHRRKEAE
ncbi:hypothetical protein DNK59_31305 [Pseudomonas sp. TKO26]|uniref:hypothetical protein n=1 Tax=unclassified Pseudomonas TaxID=196821 RepID=UPI000D80B793|nr:MULTISPECIES: hypothetical protein [unclassified Pseudomonas]PYY78063.1 hypothetical protein DNK62_31305 [Pseudomonas sp. TKO30]PYY78439.1 hypothetical protein DNK61_31295 [Pseudomonas sp. TKO29]PYY79988.1 hypothetical protein DNK59_31305 [Pseudomonas sp. TKO26]PYY95353.1 hypothetical protein DNK60_31295 [Pseudomonas sp. TKO14]